MLIMVIMSSYLSPTFDHLNPVSVNLLAKDLSARWSMLVLLYNFLQVMGDQHFRIPGHQNVVLGLQSFL